MFEILSNKIIDIFTRHSSSFLSSLSFFRYLWTGIKWLGAKFLNFIVSIVWIVVKLVLGVIDAFAYIINNMLGIGSTLGDYSDYAKSLGVSGNRNFLDTLVKTFRAIVGVSIILLLVFTIIAIVKQEIQNAQRGFEEIDSEGKNHVGNNKGGIMMRLFRNFIAIIALPLTMIFLLVGVNSILSAFNKALQGENQNVSLAGQVLSASTYDANKYRMYANAGQRIPIIIKAYDQTKYSVYEASQLAIEIRNVNVQNKLRDVATNMTNETFLTFEKSLTYKNNKLYNSTDYGDYFEQFICTPEQYQMMAEFIDYIQKYSLNYYIKSIDDPNVEWKYVKDVVYKQSSNELNITYKDNSDLNKNGSTKDCYTLTLAPQNEVTSPISDAMNSIMAMLGVGDYGNNMYNVMERDSSGDYVNLTSWANEKCYIHFSDGFVRETPSTWTDVDEILMYEYNRFSSNNTLSKFTIEELTADKDDENFTTPTLDVMQIVYRTYYEEADVYSSEKTLPCVLINGNYYFVEESKTMTDKFGNALYEIVSQNKLNNNVVVRYLDPSYSILKKTGDTTTLKLTDDFDLNNRSTWGMVDQILVYEYYKNLSYNNDLNKYSFDYIMKEGVELDIYQIVEYTANVNEKNEVLNYTESTKNCVVINGTYYQLNSGNGISESSSGEKYLLESSTEVKSHYNYYLTLTEKETYGFENGTKQSAVDFVKKGDVSTFQTLNVNDATDSKYVNFVLQLSEGFDYKNSNTWSYRDYFIFYLYINYNVSSNFDALRYTGIEGDVKKNALKYYFVTKTSNQEDDGKKLYFDIDEINKISELNINTTLDVNSTIDNNYIDTNENRLFVIYNSAISKFLKNDAETRVFNYSDDYNYYNVTTWKMVDFILNYFSSTGVINDTETLQNSGYGALKFNVKNDDGTIGDVIYKFGSNDNYYCLSETNIKNYRNIKGEKMNITSIENFLNMNVMTFICSYNCLVKNNIVTTYDDISQTLFQNYENFVLDYSNLIDTLVDDNFDSVIDKTVLYTYTNPTLDEADPSTWTKFDLIYFSITGRVSSSISGNVIIKNNKRYFVVKNKAILISEGDCSGSISDGDTSLQPTKISIGNTYSSLEEYYKNSIVPNLKTNRDLSNLTSLSSIKFKYEPGKSLDKSDYEYNPDINILDAIILMTSSNGKLENREYSFNAYTDGVYEYLNVNGKYILLTRKTSGLEGLIKYNSSPTFTLNNNAKVFTKDTATYTSFKDYTDSLTAETRVYGKFSYLDCLIYAKTENTSSSKYSIYSYSSSKKYIFVDGGFIEYTDNNKESTIISTKTESSQDTKDKKIADIDYLYETYYKEYVLSSATFNSKDKQPDTTFSTSFSVENRESWTPMGIIMYKNNLCSGEGAGNTNLTGKYGVSFDGSRTYFIYTTTSVTEGEKSIYIDVTDIGYIDDPRAGEFDQNKYLRELDSAIYELNLKIFTVIDNNANFIKDADGNILTPEEILDNNIKFADSTNFTNVVQKDTLKVEFTNANNFNLQDVTTWTWYDLVYYSMFNSAFTGDSYYVYCSSENGTHAELSNGSKSYYILSSNANVNITALFTVSGTESVNYKSTDAQSSTIGFIAYKLTNKTSSTLTKYAFTSENAEKTFYYIKNVSTGTYYGIYKLSDSTSDIKSSKTEDLFYYKTTNAEDVSSWTLFDFIIYYATTFTGNKEYLSSLETFGVSQYFVIGTKYINITVLSNQFNGEELIVKKNGTTLESTRGIKSTFGFNESEVVLGVDAQSPIFIQSYNPQEVITKFNSDDNDVSKNIANFQATLFNFTDGFNPSDYSTWSLSDIMMYYAFINGFYSESNDTGSFVVEYPEYYIEDNVEKTRNVQKTISTKNFQDFINLGGATGYVYYLVSADDYGNTTAYKVINFGNKVLNEAGIYYNYDVYMRLCSRLATKIVTNDSENNKISLKMTEKKTANQIDASDNPTFVYSVNSANAKVDFTYKNYFYFKFTEFQGSYNAIFNGINSNIISSILTYGDGQAEICGTINIKLSENFDIKDVNTWTLLDLIVIYEYSREYEGNELAEASFEDLKTLDNYYVLYGFSDDPITNGLLVLNINGSYYNVAAYVEKVSDASDSLEYKLKDDVAKPATQNIISKGGVGSYSFRTIYEKIQLTRNILVSNLIYDFDESENTFNYATSVGDRLYRSINKNTEGAYKIDFSDPEYSTYKISSLVKTVSWPEKIMTDMQVLYPDLNWSTLIATDGWLDTLGEFTSAYANGQFISKNNSSNTTAAGLVLSEFFLSVSNKVEDGFGNYEYDTLFDESVIKSLMLSLLGEEQYTNLSQQAEIFMEMFNNSFAKILDDIAEENSIDIVDGQVNNFTMCVYKSYLATVLLSSDIGEYLYTIATRVYSQYTIYESLAQASGDYGGYFAYTSGQEDENGDIVDAFTYSSFKQLVKYENMLSGESSPVYTFNMKKAYKALYGSTISLTNENFDGYYSNLYNAINTAYQDKFSIGETISDKSDLYCFMFDAYYSILNATERNQSNPPKYLELYKDYLDGNIVRWGIVKDSSITDTAKYIDKYDTYKKALTISKFATFGSIVKFYINQTYHSDDDASEEENRNFFEKIWDGIVQQYNTLSNGSTAFGILYQSVGPSFKQKVTNIKNLIDGITNSNTLFDRSEDGDNSAWLELLQIYDDINDLSKELNEINELVYGDSSSANRTENGSRKVFNDDYYSDAIDALSSLRTNLGNYISSQKMMDKIVKSSITFTLGQYGQNYVTDGFEFNIENRKYTFDANLSATRLAEYVYGGSYLTSFNINPTYTDEDYNGMIRISKTFDKKDGFLKTNLEMWPELRSFASELANYTAKLYYQTNLKNVAKNVSDGVLLTDYVNATIKTISNQNYTTSTTPEFLILYYLINESDIDIDTFIRLLFGDTTDNLAHMTCTDTSIDFNNIKKIASVLDGTSVDSLETLSINKKFTLIDYMLYVYSADYNSFGYYNSGNSTPSERIHKMFKNVISYLLVSEDAEETESEDAIVLENLSFKDFKILLMSKIVDYQQNPSETPKENTARYLTIFDLISTNFSFYEATGYQIGTVIRYVDLTKNQPASVNDTPVIKYKPLANCEIYASISMDKSTRNNILNLSGLANRPIEELVNLEYDSLYDRNGNYDEAYGDIFVVCSYDEMIGKYIPYLARSYDYERVAGSKYDEYINTYFTDKSPIKTDLYGDDQAYPIIAKGIINASAEPTAIKIVDNEVIFYRTEVIASTTLDESAVSSTMSVSEVNTVGYTKTVESTSYKKVGLFSGRTTMFISSSDMKTYLNSKTHVYFLQNDVEYNLQKDEYGGISVLDDFSAYYSLSGQTYFLLIMSFVTLIPFLFNGTAAVLRRVLDLIFLVLVGPVVISMRSLDTGDGKDIGTKAFDDWKGYVTTALLSVFGYIIGFNVYYILLSTVLQMSFVSPATMTNIQRIGGLSLISVATVNTILRYLYVLAAVAVIKTTATMLTDIITAGKVTDPFVSPLSEKSTIDAIKDMKVEAKTKLEKAVGIVNGQALLDLKNAALETAKNMVPGSAAIGQISDNVKGIGDRIQGRALKKKLKKSGVKPEVANNAAKQFVKNRRDQRKAKQNNRIKSANRFMQSYMGSKDTFSTNPHILPGIWEQLKPIPPKKKKDKVPKPKKDKKNKK